MPKISYRYFELALARDSIDRQHRHQNVPGLVRRLKRDLDHSSRLL